MIGFKNALDKRLLKIAELAVGPASGLLPYVQTFDDHLYDVQKSALPFVVAFALTKEKEAEEIYKFGDWVWTCHLYYLDITQEGESWDQGKARRDIIVGSLEKAFEGNHFLNDGSGPLKDIDNDGHSETVWRVEINTESFDQSGQEGYYTFVSEMYLSVHTSQN